MPSKLDWAIHLAAAAAVIFFDWKVIVAILIFIGLVGVKETFFPR